jgi:hypothetical protein
MSDHQLTIDLTRNSATLAVSALGKFNRGEDDEITPAEADALSQLETALTNALKPTRTLKRTRPSRETKVHGLSRTG